MLAKIGEGEMDKAEFVEKAPLYYALAIAVHFVDLNRPQIRDSIRRSYQTNEYALLLPGSETEFDSLLDADPIWDSAIAWLTAQELIEIHTDAFGPTVYVPGAEFRTKFDVLCASTSPFRIANASGNLKHWARNALVNIARMQKELNIQPGDFGKSEDEWSPIPLETERGKPALQQAISSLERTIAAVEESNGYAVQYPEERNYVLDNLKL